MPLKRPGPPVALAATGAGVTPYKDSPALKTQLKPKAPRGSAKLPIFQLPHTAPPPLHLFDQSPQKMKTGEEHLNLAYTKAIDVHKTPKESKGPQKVFVPAPPPKPPAPAPRRSQHSVPDKVFIQ